MSRFLCVLVSVLAIASPAASEELERFAGKWIQVSVEADGTVLQSGANAPRMTISGDVWIETSPAGESASRFKISPKKEPPQIDRLLDIGRRAVAVPGIYKLDGDTLTVSIPIPFGGK